MSTVCLSVCLLLRPHVLRPREWLWETMDDADGAWDRVAVLHFEYSCEAAYKSRPAGILEGSSRVDAVVIDMQTRAYKQGRRAVMLRRFLTLVGWEMLTETDSPNFDFVMAVAPPIHPNFPFLFAPIFSSLEPHIWPPFEAMFLSRL